MPGTSHQRWCDAGVAQTPAERLGSIFGVVAAGSGLGGMLFTNLVGRLVTYVSYSPVFVIMGCLHPIALALIWRAAARKPSPAS